jgi:hypothetical protein
MAKLLRECLDVFSLQNLEPTHLFIGLFLKHNKLRLLEFLHGICMLYTNWELLEGRLLCALAPLRLGSLNDGSVGRALVTSLPRATSVHHD